MIEHIIICSLFIYGLHKLIHRFSYDLIEEDVIEKIPVLNALFACVCCMSSFWGIMYYNLHLQPKSFYLPFIVVMIGVAGSTVLSFWSKSVSEVLYICSIAFAIAIGVYPIKAVIFIISVYCLSCLGSILHQVLIASKQFFEQKTGEDLNAIGEAMIDELSKTNK